MNKLYVKFLLILNRIKIGDRFILLDRDCSFSKIEDAKVYTLMSIDEDGGLWLNSFDFEDPKDWYMSFQNLINLKKAQKYLKFVLPNIKSNEHLREYQKYFDAVR
jgi:hypothetical protein